MITNEYVSPYKLKDKVIIPLDKIGIDCTSKVHGPHHFSFSTYCWNCQHMRETIDEPDLWCPMCYRLSNTLVISVRYRTKIFVRHFAKVHLRLDKEKKIYVIKHQTLYFEEKIIKIHKEQEDDIEFE